MTERAAEYSLAQAQPGASMLAGLPVLAEHAEDFSPFHTLHVCQFCLAVIVFEDCPDGFIGDSRQQMFTITGGACRAGMSMSTRTGGVTPPRLARRRRCCATDHLAP
ncbi:hypothetical protein ACIBBE_23805 [Streptomyces sp. NPDC051644]|uniref:hypothetical protein n=1 Tax=Streptomyces sp. NPDC051644 TaxID=3365666 RepID=UPI0037932318